MASKKKKTGENAVHTVRQIKIAQILGNGTKKCNKCSQRNPNQWLSAQIPFKRNHRFLNFDPKSWPTGSCISSLAAGKSQNAALPFSEAGFASAVTRHWANPSPQASSSVRSASRSWSYRHFATKRLAFAPLDQRSHHLVSPCGVRRDMAPRSIWHKALCLYNVRSLHCKEVEIPRKRSCTAVNLNTNSMKERQESKPHANSAQIPTFFGRSPTFCCCKPFLQEMLADTFSVAAPSEILYYRNEVAVRVMTLTDCAQIHPSSCPTEVGATLQISSSSCPPSLLLFTCVAPSASVLLSLCIRCDISCTPPLSLSRPTPGYSWRGP